MEYSFGKKLRNLRSHKQLTQDELAEILNKQFNSSINKGMISKWENDREEPRMETIRIIAKFFDVSLDYLMGLESDLNNTESEITESIYSQSCTYVPILNNLSEKKISLSTQDIKGYLPVSNIFLNKKTYFFLEVEDDSMDLEFPSGSFILIEKTSDLENGQIALVRINKKKPLIKKVVFGNNSISLIPMSTNKDYQPEIFSMNKEVEILGKVIQAIKIYL